MLSIDRITNEYTIDMDCKIEVVYNICRLAWFRWF